MNYIKHLILTQSRSKKLNKCLQYTSALTYETSLSTKNNRYTESVTLDNKIKKICKKIEYNMYL